MDPEAKDRGQAESAARESPGTRGREDSIPQWIHQAARIIKASPAPILLVDLQGIIRLANPRAAELLGMDVDRLQGMRYDAPDWAGVWLEGPWPDAQSGFRHLLGGQPLRGMEVEARRPDGSRMQLLIDGNPLFSAGGETLGGVFTLEDVTDRRASERERARLLENLNERVKELTLLHQVARQVIRGEEDWQDIVRDILGLLPSGFQFPQLALARVIFGDQELSSPGFSQVTSRLSSRFRVRGGHLGLVEVGYRPGREGEGSPFLEEERSLLDSVASLLASFLERRLAEEELRAERSLLEVTLRSIGDGVISTDLDGRVQFINQAAEELTGWPADLARGRSILEVLRTAGRHAGRFRRILFEVVLGKGQTQEMESGIILLTRDGQERVISDSAAPIYNHQKQVIGSVVVFRDVTQAHRYQERLEYLSFHDTTTGLYNRAFFEEELKRLDTSRQLPITVMLLDINGLKLVNDALGHREGDRLLGRVAQILKDCSREEEIICRWGGDEFAILLPRTGESDAAQIAQRIRESMIRSEDDPVPISAALGWATKTSPQQDFEAIFREAEERMYSQKDGDSFSSRSRVVFSIQRALEETDHESRAHAQRLREGALALGRRLGFSPERLGRLALAAVLHDIGKVTVPRDILEKPGSLTEDEWDLVKSHAEKGFRMVRSAPDLAPVAHAILHHHERWDGTGYPQGLKGEAIPLEARILAIVDAYDVMVQGRAHRPPLDKGAAILELKKGRGTQFDPQLVDAFIQEITDST